MESLWNSENRSDGPFSVRSFLNDGIYVDTNYIMLTEFYEFFCIKGVLILNLCLSVLHHGSDNANTYVISSC